MSESVILEKPVITNIADNVAAVARSVNTTDISSQELHFKEQTLLKLNQQLEHLQKTILHAKSSFEALQIPKGIIEEIVKYLPELELIDLQQSNITSENILKFLQAYKDRQILSLLKNFSKVDLGRSALLHSANLRDLIEQLLYKLLETNNLDLAENVSPEQVFAELQKQIAGFIKDEKTVQAFLRNIELAKVDTILKESIVKLVGLANNHSSLPANILDTVKSIENWWTANNGNQSAGLASESRQALHKILGKLAEQLVASNKELRPLKIATTSLIAQLDIWQGLSANSNQYDSKAIELMVKLLNMPSLDINFNTATIAKSSNYPALHALIQLIEQLKPTVNSVASTNQDLKLFLELVQTLQKNEQSTRDIVDTLISKFFDSVQSDTLYSKSFTPKSRQELLNKLKELVQNELPISAKSQEKSRQESLSKALTGLENMLKGQEALAQMSPMLRAAGEPIFMLFPMLLQGFLTKLEITHFKNTKDADQADSRQKNKTKNKKFKTTLLNIQLPKLGKVQVELKHSDCQVHCSFILQNSKMVDQINQQLPLLEQALQQAGYEQINCSANVQANLTSRIDLSWPVRPAIVA